MNSPWIQAARPATLWAALAPVLVAAGLASGDGVFRWDAFIAAAVGSVAIQIATNFANDASDAKRGADTEDRIGPTRRVAPGFSSASLSTRWAQTICSVVVIVRA